MAIKAIAYLRVSTDDQQLGPVAQIALMRRWATQNDCEIVSAHEDIGVSGACPIDQRPGLVEALGALSASGATVFLVAKRDRLARDVVISAVLERLVKDAGASVVAADGSANDDSPEGALFRHILAAFAEYERQVIRARTKAALAAKKSRGERTGAVPYGKDLAADGIHLLQNDREQAAIAIARDMRKDGYSYPQICAALKLAGHAPRKGGEWDKTQVRRMVI